MSDTNHRPNDGTLDRATRALQDAPVPDGPPAELAAATVAGVEDRLAGVVPGERARRLRRRRTIMRVMQYGGVSGLAAAAVVVALTWPPTRSPAEDVKRALRKAEQATSVRVLAELDAGADGKFTNKQYRQGPKSRFETEPVGLTVILDTKTNKGLMLMSKTKTYREVDFSKDKVGARLTKSVSEPLGAFKVPGDDQVGALPDEYLDGRKTKVYEIKGVDMPDSKGRADLKVWIDPRTALPVRSRMVLRAGDKTYTTTYTFLGFNEELDPKLFDLAVPEGYKRVEEPKKKDE